MIDLKTQILKMERLKVGLDVDGVLVNFYLHMCRWFNKPYIITEKWSTDWIDKKFDEIKDDKRFWLTLPTLMPPEAINFDFDYYITSIPKIQRQSRQQWLSMNGYPNKPVIVSYDKLKTCNILEVDILIDDKLATLDVIRNSDNVVGIQFIPSYMKVKSTHGDYAIRHLTGAKKIIEHLNKGR